MASRVGRTRFVCTNMTTNEPVESFHALLMRQSLVYASWSRWTQSPLISNVPLPPRLSLSVLSLGPNARAPNPKVAANIMRSRALSRATRSGVRPLLFLTCSSTPIRDEIVRAFSGSAGTAEIDETCGDGDKNNARGRVSQTSDIGMSFKARMAMDGSGRGGKQLRRARKRRWLLNLARLMARPREYEVRRAAAVRAFTPQKFRQEWELFWELVDPILDGFARATAVREMIMMKSWRGRRFSPLNALV